MAPPDHIAHTLLEQAHPPEIASALFKDKVVHKPLYLRPTSPDQNSQDARAKRRARRLRESEKAHRRRKVKPLSAKEKRMTGIYDVTKDTKKYEFYEPLNCMWQDYIRDILGLDRLQDVAVSAQTAGSKLASADYHGALLKVVRSRCAGMVGLEGIVVRDTKFTFQMITKKSDLKTIPKRHTVFRFTIPRFGVAQAEEGKESTQDLTTSPHTDPIVFELLGSQFEHRATDRATKKFKQHNLPEV